MEALRPQCTTSSRSKTRCTPEMSSGFGRRGALCLPRSGFVQPPRFYVPPFVNRLPLVFRFALLSADAVGWNRTAAREFADHLRGSQAVRTALTSFYPLWPEGGQMAQSRVRPIAHRGDAEVSGPIYINGHLEGALRGDGLAHASEFLCRSQHGLTISKLTLN